MSSQPPSHQREPGTPHAATLLAPEKARHRVWRIRGVPKHFDRGRLAEELQQHPRLQFWSQRAEGAQQRDDQSVKILSLSPDLNSSQVATVSFAIIPTQLCNLGTDRQLSIELLIHPKEMNNDPKRKRLSPQIVKITIDDHFYGLTVLFSPPTENHKLDVVAISGLGSHAFGSFMNKEDGNMWLRDQLPEDIPYARVIIFGYRSKLKDSTSFAELGDLAGLLQRELIRVIQTGKPDPNPVVLTGHSLGGLLIKEALSQLADSDGEADLIRHIQGLVFFGVPNDGMRIESLIPIVTNQPNISLVLSLRDTNSQILTYQKRNFSKILEKYGIHLVCFYEMLTSPTAEMINGEYKMVGPQECLVNRSSATSCLPTSASPNHAVGLNKNHSNLVKFAVHDDDFDRVRNILGRICEIDTCSHNVSQKSGSQVQIAEVNSCLKELGWANPDIERERIIDIKGGLYDDAFRWILDHKDFNEWKDDARSGLFWIKGDAGKGKTMLLIGMSTALGLYQPPRSSVSFFFCQNSDSSLNSSAAILKGLIYQLILQESKLASYLKAECDRSDTSIFEGSNAFYVLSRIFRQMIHDPSLSHPKANTLFFIVDALDECEVGLNQFCELISETILQSSPRLKWIVSSRHEARIDQWLAVSRGMVCLDLEINANLVSEAIRIYINWKVSNMKLLETDQLLREQVQRTLHTKADGTFLWVALVISELLRVEGKYDILDVLKDFPPGLDHIYERMLHRISEHKRKSPEVCWRILSASVFSYRPLHLEELYVLSGIHECDVKINDTQRAVRLCRSFLTVRNHYVYLIHQSAKDFLTTTSRQKNFPCKPKLIHNQLFLRSVEVMRKVLRQDIYNLSRPGTTIEEISTPDPNPLQPIEYSCIYWIEHYRDFCKDEAKVSIQKSLTDSEIIFQFLGKFLLNWLEALSLLGYIDDGVRSIRRFKRLLEEQEQEGPMTQRLIALVHDTHRFLLQNKWMMENAPLQIYTSALLFSPSKSEIRKIFENEIPTWIGRKPIVEKNWSNCLQILEGHEAVVRSVAFSNDSKLLASGSDDNTVRVWESDTGSELYKLEGHKRSVRCVDFSHHNPRLLASGSDDHGVRIWNLEAGIEVNRLEGHDSWVHSVAFSYHSKLLASGSDDCTIRLWDVETGSEIQILKGHEDAIYSVAFSFYNNRLLASGSSDCTVRIWDLESNQELHRLEGHSNWVKSVAFCNHSDALASASDDRTIRIWDSKTGSELKRLHGHNDGIRTVAFSYHDENRLASASVDCTVRLWDLRTGLELQRLCGHEEWVKSVAFSRDSKILASASDDKTIRIWDTKINSEPERLLEESQGQVQTMAFSSNSEYLASASRDRSVRLRNLERAKSHTLEGHQGPIESINFSRDSKLLASTCFKDQTVRVWDTGACSELYRLEGHHGLIRSVSFSYDSKLLAVVCYNGGIWVWNLAKSIEPHILEERGWAKFVCFSFDSKLLAAGSGSQVRIWDLEIGLELKRLDGHEAFIESVVFSKNSKLLGSVCSNGTVRIWDLEAGLELHRLNSCQDWTRPVSFSKNSKLLAIQSEDGKIQIWDIERGVELKPFQTELLYEFEEPHKYMWTLDREKSHIRFMHHDILWLPPEYRPITEVVSHHEGQLNRSEMVKLALGTDSGKVIIIGFLPSKLAAVLRLVYLNLMKRMKIFVLGEIVSARGRHPVLPEGIHYLQNCPVYACTRFKHQLDTSLTEIAPKHRMTVIETSDPSSIERTFVITKMVFERGRASPVGEGGDLSFNVTNWSSAWHGIDFSPLIQDKPTGLL